MKLTELTFTVVSNNVHVDVAQNRIHIRVFKGKEEDKHFVFADDQLTCKLTTAEAKCFLRSLERAISLSDVEEFRLSTITTKKAPRPKKKRSSKQKVPRTNGRRKKKIVMPWGDAADLGADAFQRSR